MRIFLLTSKLNFETAGGSVMDLHLKAKGLVDLGHDVSVITGFSQNNIIKTHLPYKVIEEHIPYRGLLGIQYSAYHILKNHQKHADAYYVDGQIFIYAGGLFRVFGGKVPVIPFFNTRLNCMGDTAGNVDQSTLPLMKVLQKKLRLWLEGTLGVIIANKNNAFIFNTPHVQQIYRKFGYNTEKSVVIEDFVDMKSTVEKYKITPSHITAIQKKKEHIILFSTGRMLKEKGFDIIVNAFTLLQNKDRYHVILSGDGPDKERVENLVKEKGLEKYFTFPGWVDKETLSNYFLTSQIFIFPKWWIEYGSALLTEALAFGLPCIIPGGGALEWLTHGNVLTFTNDAPEALAKQIEEFGNNEKKRILYGEKSLERVQTLDYSILSRSLSNVLEQAVAA